MSSHEDFAKLTYNECWELLGREQLDQDEQRRLQRLSYASLYHWSQVGGPMEEAIGEWMVSRVHVRLGFSEAALTHAARAVEVVRESQLTGFVVASCFEGLARAHAMNGDEQLAIQFRRVAIAELDQIEDAEDRDLIQQQIADEPWFGIAG